MIALAVVMALVPAAVVVRMIVDTNSEVEIL